MSPPAPPAGAPTPAPPRYPALYQINLRPWLAELGHGLDRPATLDDVPDLALDRLAGLGFDWLWLLGVWRTGPLARREAVDAADLWPSYRAALPDLVADDICASPFAVAGYEVAPELGGDGALARLRARLAARGLRLMLDFVPNHVGLDHPWVQAQPEWLVHGTADDLAREPRGYGQVQIEGPGDPLILAHGRDPNYPGWTDTWQLDYGQPALQVAMAEQLAAIAARCDGVRCDMAMLVLPEVFETTWGRPAAPFWPAAIARARAVNPDATFLAEAYWDLEWTLLAQGFDYCYDKRLYDRLRAGAAEPVRQHLTAGLDYQAHLARFVENHDEARAAAAFPADQHGAAAVLTYLVPGLRLFHQGQLEGRRLRLPLQLSRWPSEPAAAELAALYQRLLGLVADPLVRDGRWRLLSCRPAWPGSDTWRGCIAFDWRSGDGLDRDGRWLVVAVNYAAQAGQAYVDLSAPDLAGRGWRLTDRRDGAVYERDGDGLVARGLYVDLPGWGWHAFEVVDRLRPTDGDPFLTAAASLGLARVEW